MYIEPNYSIIIPHKDIPELLMRCLRSIPIREDVQIIVVDDNSKEAETYVEKFPELSRPNLELYLTKKGKGAGYARNVGLDHAKGKWVIFADADDFFSDNLSQILDECINYTHEILIFDNESVFSDDISKKCERDLIVKYKNLVKREHDAIRYTHNVPWSKIISRDLIERNNIRFQEIRWSNDVFFSTQIGVMAKDFLLINEVLYYVTQRVGSLMFNPKRTVSELITRANAGIDSYYFAKSRGYQGTTLFFCSWIVELYRVNAYIPFIKAIKELDTTGKHNVYIDVIWGKNRIQRSLIRLLFLLSIFSPIHYLRAQAHQDDN